MMKQMKANLFALLIGVTGAILLLAMLEFGARFTKAGDLRTTKKVFIPKNYRLVDEHGIEGARPGKYTAKRVRLATGEDIYNVEYTIDKFGRRATPLFQDIQKDRFMLFAGGSFTFGEGVNDHETLPYYAAEMLEDYRPYNYGFHGRGVFDALAVLETRDLKKEIEEKNGVMVYIFTHRHFERVTASTRSIQWHKGKMYYEAVGDDLIRKGTFAQGRPILTRIYLALSESRLLKFLKIEFPLRRTKKHIWVAARALKGVQTQFLRQFPRGRFYVLLFPGVEYSQRLIKYLSEWDIAYFDLSGLIDYYGNPKYYLAPEDLHPVPETYRLVAGRFVQMLENSVKGPSGETPQPSPAMSRSDVV